MDEKKLKPCPFCGSDDLDAEWKHNGQSASFEGVWCRMCGAKGPEYHPLPDVFTATQQWNERHKTNKGF